MATNRLYIVLTRTNTTVSQLIHHIKQDTYTHAAISFDPSLQNMYSFGRKYPRNPFAAGFRQEHINEGLYGLHKVLPGVVIEVAVTASQYGKAQSMVDSFIAHGNHYGYNYLGLLYCLCNLQTHPKNRFLCSEFVYYLLAKSDVIDLKIPRNLVRPQDFLSLRDTYNGRIRFEGDLKCVRRAV